MAKRGIMRKFKKREFSIKPIIKPMFIISVVLTILSFYIMREFSAIAKSNLFEAKSGNGFVSDREFEHVGRIFLMVFNLFITLFMNLVCVSFILGFVLCIYRILNLVLSSFRKVLLSVKYFYVKTTFVKRNENISQFNGNLYLVNSAILN